MRLKLDENLGHQAVQLFRQAGHDAATVVEQQLCGTDDDKLITICREEKRCLVTLDLDFANPITFPPSEYQGIAVLRLPHRACVDDIFDDIRTLIAGFERASIKGKLWVVQRGGIREYQEDA